MRKKVFFGEFEDLKELNEYIAANAISIEIISISHEIGRHCVYYWM